VVDVAVGDVDRGEVAVVQATQPASVSGSGVVGRVCNGKASFSPKIRVDVIGSHAIGGPNGRGRSPTTAFSGAVKTLTLSGAVMPVTSSPAAKP
jgi:hypothetical protein